MHARPLEIRRMDAQELDMVLDWAAAEGWNPGWHDAACFHAADPDGFLLGVLDGEAVASIFAVKYGARFGFIGGYVVKPALRGRGYGKALWDAAMASLAGRSVGLDGVLAQQANYARSGFRLTHRNIRFEGRGSGQPFAADAVAPLSARDADAVCRYDQAFFPDQRSRFVRCWIAQAHSVAIGILGEQGLAGYAVLRPCRQGHKIGPLFADTPALAETLFLSLQGRAGRDAPIFLDVPEPNQAAMALAARHGMRACFETARMVTGTPPALSLARQYGITTFELG